MATLIDHPEFEDLKPGGISVKKILLVYNQHHFRVQIEKFDTEISTDAFDAIISALRKYQESVDIEMVSAGNRLEKSPQELS